jgi:tetratricopeptide (TPR) repeat protein
MKNPEAETRRETRWNRLFVIGCLAPTVFFVLLFALLAFWFLWKDKFQQRKPEFIRVAEQTVGDREKKLAPEIKKAPEVKPVSDPDATATAIFSIERALKEAKSFEELTQFILQRDPELADPEILELKYRFFNIYKDLLDSRDRVEEVKSIYNTAVGSAVDLLSSFNMLTMTPDSAQIKKVWEKRLEAEKLQSRLKDRLSEHQAALIDFMFDFMKKSSSHIKRWDALCSLRDRAYLAIFEGDYEEAVRCSLEAVKMAPHETEAHILLASALLERNKETDAGSAAAVIKEFLEKNPGRDAPAVLLRGVLNMREKNYDKAMIDFDQAAAYYPKQREALSDKLDLYKRRLYLNSSREGRTIVNMRKSMMTGSGYFSPDFQKARIYMEKGEKDKAEKKVFDHFFRRRLQGEWDRILTDFQYSGKFLKEGLPGFFGDKNIRLKVEPALFTNSVIVTVSNTGKTDLHNLTVLLCARFTDMFHGDYVSFPVGETVALLKAGESVSVGRQNISDATKESLGSVRKFKDIIECAAVIISDETLAWVEAGASRPGDPEPPPGAWDSGLKLASELAAAALAGLKDQGGVFTDKDTAAGLAEIVKELASAKGDNLKHLESVKKAALTAALKYLEKNRKSGAPPDERKLEEKINSLAKELPAAKP